MSKKYILLVLLLGAILTLTGCGTIGGTLSGVGSDLKIAGDWCKELGQ
jgi:predicted small secreted protein